MLALKDRPVSSSDLAHSIGTNPAFVRQILMQLKAQGLVKARLGKSGGSYLGRSAAELSLLDIYDAVEGGSPVFARPKSTASDSCVVGRHILPVLDAVTAPAEEAFRRELEGATVADVLERITLLDPAAATAEC